MTPADIAEQLFDSSQDAFLVVDETGLVRLANRQAEELFGYVHGEMTSLRLDSLVPDRVRASHPEYRAGYFANPHPRSMGAGLELTARRSDGTEVPVDIALSPVRVGGEQFALAAIRDVSHQWGWAERARLEAQLHQSQRLESLGQLAGGVAHDFNNLLAVILNYATFVAEALDEAAPNEPLFPIVRAAILDDVEQIRRAAERAAALTHQLLIFGRREVVRAEVLAVNAVVTDLDRLLRRTLGEHIALSLRLDPDPWMVEIDPSQLEQVLVNLAVNARDAMGDGGSLEIVTENVEVDDESARVHPGAHPGRYVRLMVADSGTGMPAAVLERAFDPFFTTKARGEGSGLGLATVYGIVTQAGGHVRAYSELGVGTAFQIYLPATEQPAEPRPAVVPAARTAGGGRTVLLAEDEDGVREMTRRVLVRAGYQVLTAATGEEALRLAANPARSIALLLTDVVMPGMSGKELRDRLRVLRPDLPTLFMSGFGYEIVVHRGVVDKGVVLVEKPFTAPVLLEKVADVLAV